MKRVSSWGRLSADQHRLTSLADSETIAETIRKKNGLPIGNQRSYGDACLNPHGVLWQTLKLDHFIAFEESNGRLICEAGVLLKDIQRLVVPRGWMLPVTPGTQQISVGGAISSDVHGKNHHSRGSFGDHVVQLTLVRTSGEIIECGPQKQTDWFKATVGGMGLTGVISVAEIQLLRVPGPWLETQMLAYESLEEFFAVADVSATNWEHTVSWIDCSTSKGRGIFIRGNATEVTERAQPIGRKLRIAFVPPASLINRLTLRPATAAYYHLKKRQSGTAIEHYESFFYPLDNILGWNKLYGPRGFYQYQSVIPNQNSYLATKAMLDEIARSGQGSFLSVLKTFGDRPALGMLSFPQPGVTLALDFPNQGDKTLKLMGRLDAIVKEAGGCLYLAKDARMPRALFEASYPCLHEFLRYRDLGISSGLSRRLMGT
ncbi:MAG: FAD-binding oxidoreductase [Comamonadaceae bacterium]|nr:FAD-binding oxidoreductase [Comamonadaceae bacterium]